MTTRPGTGAIPRIALAAPGCAHRPGLKESAQWGAGELIQVREGLEMALKRFCDAWPT